MNQTPFPPFQPKAKPLPKRIDVPETDAAEALETFVGAHESIATSLLVLALKAAEEPIPENLKAVLRAQAEDIGLDDEGDEDPQPRDAA